MQERYLKNIIEAALLAAGTAAVGGRAARDVRRAGRPAAEEVCAALRGAAEPTTRAAASSCGKWRAAFASRSGSNMTDAVVAAVAGASAAVFARAARDAGADRLSAADHARARSRRSAACTVNPNIVRTLLERELDPRGRASRSARATPSCSARPREFLDYFSLKSLDELPSLAELRDMDNLGVQLELPGEVGEPTAESSDDAAGRCR